VCWDHPLEEGHVSQDAHEGMGCSSDAVVASLGCQRCGHAFQCEHTCAENDTNTRFSTIHSRIHVEDPRRDSTATVAVGGLVRCDSRMKRGNILQDVSEVRAGQGRDEGGQPAEALGSIPRA